MVTVFRFDAIHNGSLSFVRRRHAVGVKCFIRLGKHSNEKKTVYLEMSEWRRL